jgi:hypothetical protein
MRRATGGVAQAAPEGVDSVEKVDVAHDRRRGARGRRDSLFRPTVRRSSLTIAATAAAAALAFAAALALAAGPLAKPAEAHRLGAAPNCPIFPSTNRWNQRVDHLPVAARSAAIVRSIGLAEPLHPDFGSGLWDGGPIGIPITVVPGNQRRVPVSFGYADESDPGPYPVPPKAAIEGGTRSDGDRHVIVVDRDRCRLWELFAAYPVRVGERWRAGSGATWSLRSNRLRPAGWTSADAAGLPILPGLARYEELRHGSINHALRVTVPRTRRSFVYPARHFASSLTHPDLPPMGLHLRLRDGVDISSFPPQSRLVLRALRQYGMIVADNGSPWYVTGAPSKGWNNDDLHALHRVKGSDFEVVDTSSLPRPGL